MYNQTYKLKKKKEKKRELLPTLKIIIRIDYCTRNRTLHGSALLLKLSIFIIGIFPQLISKE